MISFLENKELFRLSLTSKSFYHLMMTELAKSSRTHGEIVLVCHTKNCSFCVFYFITPMEALFRFRLVRELFSRYYKKQKINFPNNQKIVQLINGDIVDRVNSKKFWYRGTFARTNEGKVYAWENLCAFGSGAGLYGEEKQAIKLEPTEVLFPNNDKIITLFNDKSLNYSFSAVSAVFAQSQTRLYFLGDRTYELGNGIFFDGPQEVSGFKESHCIIKKLILFRRFFFTLTGDGKIYRWKIDPPPGSNQAYPVFDEGDAKDEKQVSSLAKDIFKLQDRRGDSLGITTLCNRLFICKPDGQPKKINIPPLNIHDMTSDGENYFITSQEGNLFQLRIKNFDPLNFIFYPLRIPGNEPIEKFLTKSIWHDFDDDLGDRYYYYYFSISKNGNLFIRGSGPAFAEKNFLEFTQGGG